MPVNQATPPPDNVMRFTIAVSPGVILHLRRHDFGVTAVLVAHTAPLMAYTAPLCFAQARMEHVRVEIGPLACLYLDTTVFVLPGDELAAAAKRLHLPSKHVSHA